MNMTVGTIPTVFFLRAFCLFYISTHRFSFRVPKRAADFVFLRSIYREKLKARLSQHLSHFPMIRTEQGTLSRYRSHDARLLSEKGVGGMAVNTTPLSSNLLILVANDAGTGNLTRKYADLKTDAADQDVFDVGTALAGLQTRTLSAINRNNVYEIEAAV
jgi:hypothetical protein